MNSLVSNEAFEPPSMVDFDLVIQPKTEIERLDHLVSPISQRIKKKFKGKKLQGKNFQKFQRENFKSSGNFPKSFSLATLRTKRQETKSPGIKGFKFVESANEKYKKSMTSLREIPTNSKKPKIYKRNKFGEITITRGISNSINFHKRHKSTGLSSILNQLTDDHKQLSKKSIKNQKNQKNALRNKFNTHQAINSPFIYKKKPHQKKRRNQTFTSFTFQKNKTARTLTNLHKFEKETTRARVQTERFKSKLPEYPKIPKSENRKLSRIKRELMTKGKSKKVYGEITSIKLERKEKKYEREIDRILEKESILHLIRNGKKLKINSRLVKEFYFSNTPAEFFHVDRKFVKEIDLGRFQDFDHKGESFV
jgi:hypothetical protein